MALPRALIDPELIYHEPAVGDYQRRREVLARFPNAELVEVTSHWEIAQLADPSTSTVEQMSSFSSTSRRRTCSGHCSDPSIQRARLPPLAH